MNKRSDMFGGSSSAKSHWPWLLYYSSPADAKEYIAKHSVSFTRLKQFMPDAKADTEEEKSVQLSKNLDKGKSFSASKVRPTIKCASCRAIRVIYSDHAVGTKKRPTKEQLRAVECSLENWYVCGDNIESDSLFVKRQLRCKDYIESQYCNPAAGLKGGRILTKDVCAICYDDEDIVTAEEIQNGCDIGGKDPLLFCRYCFDKKVEIPFSGGRTNMTQKKDQQ